MRKIFYAISFVFGLMAGCTNAQTRVHTVEWIKKPCIEPITNYDYNICQSLEVRVDDKLITIPKGFITDLASIPKPLWPVLAPQYAGFVYPAILHDFFYRCPDNVTREYADDVFYYALKAEGISTYTAYKLWLGVRTFGGSHFAEQDSCHYKYYYEAEAQNLTMKG